MTLSYLQGHSLLQAFRCDFYPRDAMLACPSVCLLVVWIYICAEKGR